MVGARARRFQQAGEEVGGPVEGGPPDVLAALRAGAEVGEEERGVLPGGLADRAGDQERDEVGQALAGVGDGGSGGGDLGGEAAAAGAGVRVQSDSAQKSA